MSDYIKLFDSKNQQDTFAESEDYVQPHVSCTKGGGNLRYNNGSGGITADSITPELLEDTDVLRKIQNWGLSDEEIENLHTISIEANGFDLIGDILCIASSKANYNNIDVVTIDGTRYNAGNEINIDCIDVISELDADFLLYGEGEYKLVLKKVPYFEDIEYTSIDEGVRVFFYITRSTYVEVCVGRNSF